MEHKSNADHPVDGEPASLQFFRGKPGLALFDLLEEESGQSDRRFFESVPLDSWH
ncbi:hypothetical protein [Cyclobacterium xiamenense]|uniref:hypothetical protein n=1 Tax=Cyclobacterium xiamenense TaxID=1297121 RepID=UPI0012B75122|nr:hypothetical protein [Cyclobacterium xiamenense]